MNLMDKDEYVDVDKDKVKDEDVKILLPLFSSQVSCGFESPADDFIEKELSLDQYLVPSPTSTFFCESSRGEYVAYDCS